MGVPFSQRFGRFGVLVPKLNHQFLPEFKTGKFFLRLSAFK